MAYQFQVEEGLTQEQAETLRELNSFHQVSESIAWAKLKQKLADDVDEAAEELLGCMSGLEMRGLIALRWQQRVAIQRDLLTFMDAHIQERQKLLEEIKEQEAYEHSSNDTRIDPS